MATVLDFSILANLSIVFVFIVVFVSGWGLAMLVDPFGLKKSGNTKIYAVLAFAMSFVVILNRALLEMIKFGIPWLTLLLLLAFFMLFFARMFNPELDASGLISNPTVYGFLIFFVGIILLFSFGAVFGQGLLETQPGISDADRIAGDTRPLDTFVAEGDFVDEEPVSTSGSSTTVASSSFSSNLALTLFHPKILGMLFMLLLATITILLLAR